jgi:H2-forming N5,N10-methylenetetrahydromethanopterin dehydrogenase-like enzyme
VIFFSMAKSGAEDDDANDYDDDNAMFFEPFGTNWNEIFKQISRRHSEGAVFAMLDTHAVFKKSVWLEGREGKLALNPRCVDVANNVSWSGTRCSYTGQ